MHITSNSTIFRCSFARTTKSVLEVLTNVFAHKETFTFNKYKYLHTHSFDTRCHIFIIVHILYNLFIFVVSFNCNRLS